MAQMLSVGEAKKRFSEIMSRVIYKRERFIISRRGKPMVALISSEDLDKLGEQPDTPKGLLAAVGAWADFEELDEVVDEIYRQRERAIDREVVMQK